MILLLSLFRVENRVCLSHSVQVTGAAWRAAMRIVAGVGDLVQRTENGHTGRVLCGRMIGRSGDVVCSPYYAHRNEKRMFLG
jgi:hypothetical protein